MNFTTNLLISCFKKLHFGGFFYNNLVLSLRINLGKEVIALLDESFNP
jgi:hypothetical protein